MCLLMCVLMRVCVCVRASEHLSGDVVFIHDDPADSASDSDSGASG